MADNQTSDDSTLPQGGDAIGTGNDARIALLNAIGDSNDTTRAEDLADVNDDGTTEPFTASVSEPEPEPEPEAEPEPALHTLKVNGKEETVTYEELIARAQKVSSADEYLRQAKQTTAPEPVALAPQISAEETAAQELAERRALARAIQMGTEEEAIAAIGKLQTSGRQPTLTVEDISRVTDERLKFNGAISWFNTEYKDLTSEPQLHRMVLDAEAALVKSGDTRPYQERYKEVGDSVRKWRDSLISSAPAGNVASLASKRAVKAAAPQAPTPASVKATPPAQEEEDDSPSAVIAAMAKARGGPQWARG